MDKIYILMATIPQRQSVLLTIIDSFYSQVDEIRIVFNDYAEIPDWVQNKTKIVPLLNTPDCYTSNAVWLAVDNIDGYVFICDDDIVYPPDYVSTMISKIKEFGNKAIISLYGEYVHRPFSHLTEYIGSRTSYLFTEHIPHDIFVDIAGCGCSLFHTDYLCPSMQDFPDRYSRDLWFSILAHKNKLPIIRMRNWGLGLSSLECSGPKIREIWSQSDELTNRRRKVFKNILLPLLLPNSPRS